jgi:nitrogen-specific signal transduction histidine kinase
MFVQTPNITKEMEMVWLVDMLYVCSKQRHITSKKKTIFRIVEQIVHLKTAKLSGA